MNIDFSCREGKFIGIVEEIFKLLVHHRPSIEWVIAVGWTAAKENMIRLFVFKRLETVAL